MSKAVHAVIAIFIGLLVAGSLRSFGTPVRGFGDEVIFILFLLAVVAGGIFVVWLAISSFSAASAGGGGGGGGGTGGGGGGAGGAPVDLTPVIAAVNTGFGNMGNRLQEIYNDTQHTRGVVDGMKAALDGLVKMMGKWMPALGKMLQTVQKALKPIGQSVEDVKKNMVELDKWRAKEWPDFTKDLAAHMQNVATKAQAAEGEFKHLKDEVVKLEKAQVQTTTAVAEVRKQQDVLQKAVVDGFSAVPAAVAGQVQANLILMERALTSEIGKVAVSQSRMEGMLSGFVTAFGQFDTRVSGQIRDLGRDLDANITQKLKAELLSMKGAVIGEVSKLRLQQSSTQEAVVRLSEAQEKMRVSLEGVLRGLPDGLRLVLEQEVGRIAAVFKMNIDELRRDQERTTSAVSGLSSATQAAKDLIVARLQENQDKMRDQLTAQLASISQVIEREIDPLARELSGVTRTLGELMKSVIEQGGVLTNLSENERERFRIISDNFRVVQELLNRLDKETAKADVLANVDRNVGIIINWLGEHGRDLDAIAGKFPELNTKLDELKKLAEKCGEKQKRVREKTGQAVVRQNDVFMRIQNTQYKFNHTQYDTNALLFLTKLVMLHQAIDAGITGADLKLSVTETIKQLTGAREQLCTVKDSSHKQLQTLLIELKARQMKFPPNLKDELEVLTELCEPKGRLAVKLAELVRVCGLKSAAKKRVQALIDEVVSDKAWSEVAGSLSDDLKKVYAAHSSAGQI